MHWFCQEDVRIQVEGVGSTPRTKGHSVPGLRLIVGREAWQGQRRGDNNDNNNNNNNNNNGTPYHGKQMRRALPHLMIHGWGGSVHDREECTTQT